MSSLLPVLDGDVVCVELALALDGDEEGRAAARGDQLSGEGLRLEAARKRALQLLDGLLNELPGVSKKDKVRTRQLEKFEAGF